MFLSDDVMSSNVKNYTFLQEVLIFSLVETKVSFISFLLLGPFKLLLASTWLEILNSFPPLLTHPTLLDQTEIFPCQKDIISPAGFVSAQRPLPAGKCPKHLPWESSQPALIASVRWRGGPILLRAPPG